MSTTTIFDNGKPIATSDNKEAERLIGRIAIIDEVLKEMGYLEGYAKANIYIPEMVKKDFKEYKKLTERVDKLAKERGV